MKPKRQYKPGPMDDCQTPAYALDPILAYLTPRARIWEPATGKGRIVAALREKGFKVAGTDIHGFENTDPVDFLDDPHIVSRSRAVDYIITNPPYSRKSEFMERCIQLGIPWALLMPVEWIGSAACQKLLSPILAHLGLGRASIPSMQFEWILMDRRVDFEMPNKGFDGRGAQFPVAWYTCGLGIGTTITLAQLNKPKRSRA